MSAPDTSLIEENKALREAMEAVFRFCLCEMGWNYWRSEFLSGGNKVYENSTKDNAEKIRRYLRDVSKQHPIVKQIIKIAEDR